MQLPQPLQSARRAVRVSTMETLREARAHAPSWRRRLLSFAISFVLVLVILGIWNRAQNLEDRRAHLWGELVFVVLVIWFALVVLSSLAAKGIRRLGRIRRLGFLRCLRIYPISRPEAFVWAVITVVTVPLAVRYYWGSLAVLAASLGVAATALYVLRRRYGWVRHFPYYTASVVASSCLLAAAWYWTPTNVERVTLADRTDPVPEAETIARYFRPLLFLDLKEAYEPVDIADATMHGCTHGLGAEECNHKVKEADALDKFDYVMLPGTKLGPGEKPGGPDSSIYHHVVEDKGRVYIDYWWYFARNPAPVARGFLCGQALGWLSEACAEHAADWEGITLVLLSCRPDELSPECETTGLRVAEARYAQHDKVVTYRWQVLQSHWSTDEYAKWYAKAGARPLVFVALHSHASYAGKCERCPQIVRPAFEERRNGKLPWENNKDEKCDDCLKPVPVDVSGAPSQWNAFRGRWGVQHCILFESVCDIQEAPRAPSFQPRYRQLDCPTTICVASDRI
jgi:hypothetical protein